jgi:hypothetical protein
VASPSSAFNVIGQFKKSADVLDRLYQLLNVDNHEALFERVSQLFQLPDRLEAVLDLQSPERILQRIEELCRSSKILDSLLTNLGCEKDTEVLGRVSQILEENSDRADFASQILASLKLTSPLSVPNRLAELLANSQLVTELCSLFEVSRPESLKSAASELVRERSELSSLFGSQKVVQIGSQLLQNLETAAQLFSRVIGVLSSGRAMKVSFPLSKAVEERLIRLIAEFKDRINGYQHQIDAVIEQAAALGYQDSRLPEAVDFIVHESVEAERQRLSEQMHRDMTEVRSVSEKQRKLSDSRQTKAKQRILELRGAIASLQERSAKREDELLLELDAERKRLRQISDELANEKKIHEELMLVISGHAADGEYLRSKLSEREMKELVKAQETRRFIDQMEAKHVEEQRLLELTRRNRQEAFRKGGHNPG